MKLWVGLGAALFAAMVVVVAVKLSADFLPAKHLDVHESAYFVDETGRARLVLVVLDVALDGVPQPRILPPTSADADTIVELRSAPRAATAPKHNGTVTLDLAVPRAAALTVLDHRWGHGEHPEGHRFPLQKQAPPDRTEPAADGP